MDFRQILAQLQLDNHAHRQATVDVTVAALQGIGWRYCQPRASNPTELATQQNFSLEGVQGCLGLAHRRTHEHDVTDEERRAFTLVRDMYKALPPIDGTIADNPGVLSSHLADVAAFVEFRLGPEARDRFNLRVVEYLRGLHMLMGLRRNLQSLTP